MAFLNHRCLRLLRTSLRSGRLALTIAVASAWADRAPAAVPPAAPASATAEYQVKAVFLFNFAQFVDWPPSAFADAQSPVIIGVLGEDPFGPYLDELVRGEKIAGRSMTVVRFARVEDVGDCHILFICRSEAPQLQRILAHLQGRSILTVGDFDNFAVQGGMVRFATENKKIQLKINLEAAVAANLTISSKLLRPATLVTPLKK